MTKKLSDTTTFQELEQDAYHAFIEWPLFLVRKIKQLEQHLAAAEENLSVVQKKGDVTCNVIAK